jgi:flagellar biosynthesis protein FlhG
MRTDTGARRYAVLSGKGGVGKSVVSANLAAAFSTAGLHTLVIDADLGLASLDVILGLAPAFTLHDVLRGTHRLQDVVLPSPGGFDLLPAGSGLLEGTTLTADISGALRALLGEVDLLYDAIVLDAGAGIGDIVLFFAQQAHEVLVVANPEPTSVMDAYATIKILVHVYGRREVNLIVNRGDTADPARTGATVAANLQQVVSRFLVRDDGLPVRIHLAGSIPSDPALAQSVVSQRLLFASNPKAPSMLAIAQLARTLCSRSAAR